MHHLIRFTLSLYLLTITSLTIATESAQLIVNVHGLTPNQGQVKVAVYTPNEEFLGDAQINGTETVGQQESMEFIFDLPHGIYAISSFYDVNMNDELDTNFLLIPTEPVGFANQPSSKFGPPSFEDAAVEIHGKKVIQITLKPIFE